jgi:hypothetical protein
VIAFGQSSQEPTTFDVSSFYAKSGARMYALRIFDELDRHQSGPTDLRFLADEVVAGRLDPGVSVVESWRDAGALATALTERRVEGKAVLRID